MISNPALLPALSEFIGNLTVKFDQISPERKIRLHELSDYINGGVSVGQLMNLNFICTHNSRRSHIAQIWAQTAAHYYKVPNIHCYSGGTQATAFNPSAVRAMQQAGFVISRITDEENPIYNVTYCNEGDSLRIFSKRYDHAINPPNKFAAIMTCSDADANCPIIVGMDKRISLPYDDPKHFDGTLHETEKYLERVKDIGTEMLYCFSRVKKYEEKL